MDKLLTLKEVAEYLRVSPYTVKFYIRRKGLPVFRVGKQTLRFSKDEIDKWLRNTRYEDSMSKKFREED
jgi:excisionase family DNA binding protein